MEEKGCCDAMSAGWWDVLGPEVGQGEGRAGDGIRSPTTGVTTLPGGCVTAWCYPWGFVQMPAIPEHAAFKSTHDNTLKNVG